MAYHESFWVAASAAAPVIALAAIVALPDAATMVGRASGNWSRIRYGRFDYVKDILESRGIDTVARAWRRQSLRIWGATLINLTAQAGLLAVSLWALAYNQDVILPPVGVILATGGILLLAWSTIATLGARGRGQWVEQLNRQLDQEAEARYSQYVKSQGVPDNGTEIGPRDGEGGDGLAGNGRADPESH